MGIVGPSLQNKLDEDTGKTNNNFVKLILKLYLFPSKMSLIFNEYPVYSEI